MHVYRTNGSNHTRLVLSTLLFSHVCLIKKKPQLKKKKKRLKDLSISSSLEDSNENLINLTVSQVCIFRETFFHEHHSFPFSRNVKNDGFAMKNYAPEVKCTGGWNKAFSLSREREWNLFSIQARTIHIVNKTNDDNRYFL